MSANGDSPDFCAFMKYVFSGKRDPAYEATFTPALWITPRQMANYTHVSKFLANRPVDQFTSSYERVQAILKPVTSDEYYQMLKANQNYRPSILSLVPDPNDQQR